MAITAGIDTGAKDTKVVVLDGCEVVGRGLAPTGFDPAAAVEEALARALAQRDVDGMDLARVIATDAAAARGAVHVHPEARTVVDVGAEDARAYSVDGAGEVVACAAGDRCAAGAGTFTEAMSRALGIGIEDLGALSAESTRRIEMNAQCTVFAETELVSLIHANVPVADIARSVHDAIASRVASMVRRVGVTPDVLLVGGLGRNVGFRSSLADALGTPVIVPDHPEFVAALGAALRAQDLEGR